MSKYPAYSDDAIAHRDGQALFQAAAPAGKKQAEKAALDGSVSPEKVELDGSLQRRNGNPGPAAPLG
jgi:hypothetical protein